MQIKKEQALRFLKFSIVGTSGVFVNLGSLFILVRILELDKYFAGILSVELSILNNFFWNNLWTWRDRRLEPWYVRLIKYNLATVATSAFGNYVVYALLLKLGVHYMISMMIGIGVAVLINFLLSDRWVFK